MKKILITGGLGFIGTNLIETLIKLKKYNIINLDKNSKYSNSKYIQNLANYEYIKINLAHKDSTYIIQDFKPNYIFHLAAESHVDRSITDPNFFIKNNINATINILNGFSVLKKKGYQSKLHCVSTDEIYGDLKFNEKPFTESSQISPNSPYSASKASSDLICKAWTRTYGVPILITNCSNNFGPYQYPEKIIPFNLKNALNKKKITIYGNGKNIRDWIYVQDHVKILIQIMKKKMKYLHYNIGGEYEISNIDLMIMLANQLNILKFKTKYKKLLDNNLDYKSLIKFVKDRPGHDFRYAIKNELLNKEINSKKILNNKIFEEKFLRTIEWYLSKKI